MHYLTLPDTRTRELPTSWGKVTLEQSARLAELPENADSYSLLAVLLNLSPAEVMNLPTDFVHEQVLPALAFMQEEAIGDYSTQPLPPSIVLPFEFGRCQLPVPQDLASSLTFGQATDLGDVLQNKSLSIHEQRQRVLAIVLYRQYVDGNYESDAIEDFARDVCSQAALEDALPITDFFLIHSTASGVLTWPSSSPSPSAPTSARPASKSWWKNGMPWLWSTRWPVATKRSGPTSGA